MTAPAPKRRPASLRKGARLVVTDDRNGLSLAVAARLDAEGFRTEIVGRGDRVPEDCDGVVYLSAVRDFDAIDEAMNVPFDAFCAARRVAAKFSTDGGLFVVVQDTGGAFATDEWCDPNKAPTGGLAGLAKTAAQEWPRATARVIDIDAGHRDVGEVAEELVQEILNGGDDVEVGLPEGRRLRLEMVTEEVRPAAHPSLEPGDVVVVSGGARGVTAACALELGRRTGARFLLLGRSPLPPADELEAIDDEAELKKQLFARAKASGEKVTPAAIGKQASRIASAREIRQTLADFDRLGLEARYVSVDVRDAAALYAVLDEIRDDWGPIRGLVHGAGVILDRHIAEKTDEQFQTVFETKVHGFWALLTATAGDPLRVVSVFSSVAGRAGNVGQVDYSIANEVITKMTQIEARRRPDAVVKSFAWGPWDGGMVGPGLRKLFQERGIALIPIDVGARMFADEILGDSEDVEIVIGSLIELETSDSDDEDAQAKPAAKPEVLERIVRVDAERHRFLLDHAIDGTPVLPLVVAIEFFIETLRPWFSPNSLAIEDVRVLRGVRLRSLDHGEALRIRAERTSNGVEGAKLELYDGTGELAYTAQARQISDEAPDRLEVDASNDAFDAEVYDGRLLFHGPTLRVLHDVGQPGDDGMRARVYRAPDVGWPAADYHTDPATMDGAMQLAVLWTAKWVNGLSLPLKVARFRQYAPFDGELELRLRGRTATNSRAVSDVDVIGPDGNLVASLRGVEVYKYRSR